MSDKKPIPFTDDGVNELLELLDAGPYGELTLETDRFKLHLTRDGEGHWNRETRNKEAAEDATPVATAREVEEDEVVEGQVNVPAPMGGVFYRAPKPGAEPFVQVGDRVEKDTIVAIVEVMKLMNSIRAGVSGEVVEVVAENARFIEQGRTMFRVKPD